jgi:hypothetical protein
VSLFRALLICGVVLCSVSAAVASASNARADLLIMQAANVRVAQQGQIVYFTSYAVNNGPGAGELNANVESIRGAEILRQRCQGVSPDTPYCEWGFVPVGNTRRMILKVRLTGDPGSRAVVTVCTDSLGSTIDPDPSNDCAVTSIRISQ